MVPGVTGFVMGRCGKTTILTRPSPVFLTLQVRAMAGRAGLGVKGFSSGKVDVFRHLAVLSISRETGPKNGS